VATLTSRLIVSLTDRVTGPARGIGAALGRLHRQGQRTSGALIGGGAGMVGGTVRNMLAIGAGYVGVSKAIGGTIGASIKFEEAFADVRKVVDGTPAQLSAVRSEILDMSKHLPVTAEGLASIYAAAGQSGVALQELGKFSEMAAKVSVAWDTSQADTGDALAKIKTQLGLNVDDLGKYADAINYLSNESAANAPNLVEYAKRVAAVGKIAGFQSTETLAFGGAMIAAGAESEVAATSFRNMAKALTKGGEATKKQRMAFARLGLDSVKTAKNMQKNALKTTLDVIDRVQNLPEWERMSISSALFGDEARGLQPIIADTRELRRELGMVADAAIYAGSANKEYQTRADTTANSLQLLGNRIRAIGIEIGDGWNPFIKQAADGVGDILISLKQRVGILDDIRASFEGFFGGLGGVGKNGEVGGVVKMMNDLGDAFFGKKFNDSTAYAVDERVVGLAKLSNRMREIGGNFRQFFQDVSAGNIGDAIGNLGAALAKMSGSMTVGGALAIGLTGAALIKLGQGAAALALSKAGQIAIMAMAVSTLINAVKDAGSIGEFADNLSSLSTLDLALVAAGIGLVGLKVWNLVAGYRALNVAKSAGAAEATGPKAPGQVTAGEAATPKGKPGTDFGPRPRNTTGPWGYSDPAPEGTRVGPTGPKGLGPQAPSGSAQTIMDGLKNVGTGWLKGLGAAVASWAGEAIINDAFRALGKNPDTLGTLGNAKALWDNLIGGQDVRERYQPKPEDNASSFVGTMKWLWNQLPSDLTKPVGSGPSEVNVIGVPEVSIPSPVTTQPSGTQDVRVTNPQPAPNITVHVTATQDPQAIAAAAVAAISAKWNALSRGAFSDGAN